MKKSVSKSIRLPEYLVEYVEAQPGKDFTSKLFTLLEDCRIGEKKRQEEKTYYERLIDERRKELRGYNDILMTVAKLRRDVLTIERILSDTFKALDSNQVVQ